MAPRKSMAMRRTMRHNASTARHSNEATPDSAIPVRTTIFPTKVRHIEAALAIALWLAYIPVMMYVRSNALSCVFVFLVIALILHAYTMRPYCVEFDEEEEAMMAMQSMLRGTAVEAFEYGKDKGPAAFDISNKDNREELKLVFFIVTILCTVGSSIAFSMGGYDVLHSWLSPAALNCSLSELPKLQKEHSRFACNDGHVNLSLQRTALTTGGVLVKTYNAYRIAPIYLHSDDKTGKPVAWAVSKNAKLLEKPCGDRSGLCGIFASSDHGRSDEASFEKLKTIARDEIVKAGTTEAFDQDSIPAVVLTSLGDPEGKATYFYVGVIFHIVVLLGLCATQFSMLMEAPSKFDGDMVFGTRPGYDQLNERGAGGGDPDESFARQITEMAQE